MTGFTQELFAQPLSQPNLPRDAPLRVRGCKGLSHQDQAGIAVEIGQWEAAGGCVCVLLASLVPEKRLLVKRPGGGVGKTRGNSWHFLGIS